MFIDLYGIVAMLTIIHGAVESRREVQMVMRANQDPVQYLTSMHFSSICRIAASSLSMTNRLEFGSMSGRSLESEHRHKAQVESGVRELKENFGLDVLRKHGFMANWAWLLVVATALNLTRWAQLLGSLDADGDMRAKRFRYRYLNIPALLVRSGRRLVFKLQRGYPLFDRFVAALLRLQSLPAPVG
jgi:hypothetical protein